VSYTVIRPANHYPSRLPEFGDMPVVKLVTPRLAPSRIGEYLVSLDGTSAPLGAAYETFFYVLEGSANGLSAGGFAYAPPGDELTLTGQGRVLIVKRRYEPAGDTPPPQALTGHRDDEPFQATAVEGFTRRELLPVTDPAFDFAMSLLAFAPDVGLPNVEIHDEEHGLYMTAGGGDYLLETDHHDVEQGDFIYMPPYCPQGFTAASNGAEYLLYKDTWRDGFQGTPMTP
jgi:(S)-ureidoglycine aminohydrolase